MIRSLPEDLQSRKTTLDQFKDITLRILSHLPNVITSHELKRGYIIYASNYSGVLKYIRPIRQELFISNPVEFENEYGRFLELFNRLKSGEREFSSAAYLLIDKIVYTIQQGIGAGLDLMIEANSGRKHVGNRFEELIRLLVNELGVANKKIVMKIPYENEEGTKTYSCETDFLSL